MNEIIEKIENPKNEESGIDSNIVKINCLRRIWSDHGFYCMTAGPNKEYMIIFKEENTENVKMLLSGNGNSLEGSAAIVINRFEDLYNFTTGLVLSHDNAFTLKRIHSEKNEEIWAYFYDKPVKTKC